MPDYVQRETSMRLSLSAYEQKALGRVANQLGMSRNALIRQWIRQADERLNGNMQSPEELIRKLHNAFILQKGEP